MGFLLLRPDLFAKIYAVTTRRFPGKNKEMNTQEVALFTRNKIPRIRGLIFL